MRSSRPFGSAKNFYCCRLYCARDADLALEVLRISTVVDRVLIESTTQPLEVLRISTVVDLSDSTMEPSFGSAKNFYCCR